MDIPHTPTRPLPSPCRRRSAALLAALVALAALTTACEDPAGDTAAAEPARFQVLAGASEAIAFETCEGYGVDGEADVYHWVELLGAAPDDEEFTLLNDSLSMLIQLGLDESTHLGLANTNATFDAVDGYQLMFTIEGYENDPGGPSVEDARSIVWEYDARRACWWRTDEGASSLEAPCTSVPDDVWYTAYDFFYVHDAAQYCNVRFRIYTAFRGIALVEEAP